MKKILLSSLFITLLICKQSAAQERSTDLIFEDKFDGGLPNPSNWNVSNTTFFWEKVNLNSFSHSPDLINIPLGGDKNNSWMMIDAFKKGAADDKAIDTRLYSNEFNLKSHSHVFLKFDHLFRKGTNDHIYVEVSEDGKKWNNIELFKHLNFIEFQNRRQTPYKVENPSTVILDLTQYLAYKPKAFVAFRYKKAAQDLGFSWQIDNIELWEKDPTPACDIAIHDDYYAIPHSMITPNSQIEPLDFLLNIENRSNQDQKNIIAEIKIFDAITGDILFREEEKLSKLLKDSSSVKLFAKRFLPFKNIKSYIGEYRVSPTCVDENPENNVQRFKFSLSDNSSFQKETEGIFAIGPSESEFNGTMPKWEWGNFYKVNNGKNFYATSISFGYIADFNKSVQGDDIRCKLYKWKNANLNDKAEAAELTLVGQATQMLSDCEEKNKFCKLEVPLFDTKTNTKSILLEDSTTYFAVVEYIPKYLGHGLSIVANDTMFYAANDYWLAKKYPEKYTSAIKVGNAKDYETSSFDYQMVPMIRLHVESKVDDKEAILEDTSVKLFPNPTTDYVNISCLSGCDFDEIMVQNYLGQTVLQQTFSTTIDVSDFPNGAYNLIMKKDNSMVVRKLQVLKGK